MTSFPRVALFADTFHEINGAANVIRLLTKFAGENDRPFLCVRAGRETKFEQQGNLQILELKRSNLSFPVDNELKYDPWLWRYKSFVNKKLKEFNPEVLHVTGLNDVSQFGFFYGHFWNVPLVASWHTNTHEYAARRLVRAFSWLPEKAQRTLNNSVEKSVMYGLMKLHFMAQVQLAPNEELVAQIQRMTNRPSFLMSRGVDVERLNPKKRQRADDTLILGYVGRLRPEKNVRFFAEVEKALLEAGVSNYKFVLIGEGSEDEWLQKNLQNAELTGVQHGGDLARAYANMDLFVFPSKTDAFGNVVLEAMAAGVPGVVMNEGGQKFLIEHGKSGFIAKDDKEFIEAVVNFAKEPARLIEMREAARRAACERSWESVFEKLYENYRFASTVSKKVRAKV